ncbi:MAG: hypothetical protein SGI73_04055 [Chloroflexota bacterium]|nr:hypothetical protein [Chloroflexota bacterium]
MFWLIRQIVKSYSTWDRPTQIALLAAVGLFIPTVIVALIAPDGVRPFAWFGAGMLLLTAQIAVMWGSRGMVGVTTLAQRAYLAGDLARARMLLEQLRTSGSADFRALTLLGNVYRQEARLDESLTVLYEAIDKVSDHPFPFVGIGRTLLSMGEYIPAAVAFEQALAFEAPDSVWVDLAEGYFRLDRADDARAALDKSVSALSEVHMALMAAYLRYRLGVGNRPPKDLIETGMIFWRAAAVRFAHTSYGVALADDIRVLDELIQET